MNPCTVDSLPLICYCRSSPPQCSCSCPAWPWSRWQGGGGSWWSSSSPCRSSGICYPGKPLRFESVIICEMFSRYFLQENSIRRTNWSYNPAVLCCAGTLELLDTNGDDCDLVIAIVWPWQSALCLGGTGWWCPGTTWWWCRVGWAFGNNNNNNVT